MNAGGIRGNQSGKGTPYDNTASGMTATNVNAAIDELKGIGAAGSMGFFPLAFHCTLTTSNEFFSITESSINSAESQYVLPFACKLVGMSFMNDSNDRDTDVEVHSATGTATASTRDLIFQIRNARSAHATNFTPVSYAAGTRLALYAVDQGDDPSDTQVTLFFQVTSLATANTQQNFSGNLTRTSTGGTTVGF